jgi:hypothetical protein
MLVHHFSNSTAIARASFNLETRQMDVQFVSGQMYSYDGVPPEVFESFITASSPGRFYQQNVKGVF